MDVRPRSEEVSPQLLDFISGDNKKEWLMNNKEGGKDKSCCEETKLELRLGPPGQEWPLNHHNNNINTKNKNDSLLSLGYFPSQQNQKISTSPWASSSANPSNNSQKRYH